MLIRAAPTPSHELGKCRFGETSMTTSICSMQSFRQSSFLVRCGRGRHGVGIISETLCYGFSVDCTNGFSCRTVMIMCSEIMKEGEGDGK